ncbi:hypothetical protein EV356DRAFT_504155 [Viridothelium virens]|uniref:Uncharacterized protein n=1 Tax=Viridothelium virens TaxID=1048519 RepID=A0A6A6HL37_VIRVR|nr:hypothetical protein EV356DRAFT_504155 [Viridothelium virens]
MVRRACRTASSGRQPWLSSVALHITWIILQPYGLVCDRYLGKSNTTGHPKPMPYQVCHAVYVTLAHHVMVVHFLKIVKVAIDTKTVPFRCYA